MTSPNLPSNLPLGEFRASPTFIQWPAVLVLLNLIIIAIAIFFHQIPLISLFGAMAFAFLAVFLSAATLRVSMSEEGLKQRWVWGWRTVGWHEVATVERVRRRFFGDGLFLLNAQDREIFAVSALPLADQEVITAEAIKRARLRKDKKPPKRPVIERWVRK